MIRNTIAVNEDEIDSLIMLITDSSWQIRKLFNEIQDLAEDSKVYSECGALDVWRNNIKSLKVDCDIVIRNLATYKDDLRKIKMLHNDKMVELSRKIESESIVKGIEHERH